MAEEKKRPVPVPDEFDKTMQGIVGTPKQEVDKAEEKDRRKKDADGRKWDASGCWANSTRLAAGESSMLMP